MIGTAAVEILAVVSRVAKQATATTTRPMPARMRSESRSRVEVMWRRAQCAGGCPPPQVRRIWAHSWFSNSRNAAMSVTPLASPRRPDALAEARIHLAAAYRLAVLHELDEGIDNHLTMRVP